MNILLELHAYMDITQQNFSDALNLIGAAQKILLVSHRRPDGDTLGATVGLALGLLQLGKKVTPACMDEVPRRLQFISALLPQGVRFAREFNMFDFDLIIISDAGAYHMTGFHERYADFLSKKVPILNIDHHASNEGFGTVNLVDTKASSATMVTWKLLKQLGVNLTQEIGLALLAGIYNDTGGFVHSNTTKETFEIAGELAKAGVNITDITRPMFRESTFAQLKLWGFILENLQKNDKQVLSSVVTASDLKMMGAHGSDTGGIVDLMNTVPDAQFVMLLAEDDGQVKGSLRTQRDDVNLSDIAGQFGGGGHPKASGFRVQGRLKKETVWKVVS